MACMSVLHAHQIEILLPIGPLFFQRQIAKADFHPANGAVLAPTGLGHVAQIFIACHRTLTERSLCDRSLQRCCLSWLNASGDEISHAVPTSIWKNLRAWPRGPLAPAQ